LILEDNAVTRRVEIVDLAKSYGYDPVAESSSPSEAISKWNEDGPFDVCVVDLDMAGDRQGGFAFVNDIPFPPNTEILIYSGHLDNIYGAIKATARRAITAYRKGQEREAFLAHLKRIADEQLSAGGGYQRAC
jgi:DNA-binding NarL/FixJ family response regulator